MSDLRYALRQWRAAPGFALAVIAILALGIGANVAMFSIVNAYLLAPLPYPQPAQLARVWEITDRNGRANSGGGVAIDLMDHATSFEVATFAPLDLNLAEGDRPRLVSGGEVTEGFFRVLGIQPMLGRGFTAEEDAPGSAARVVVVTHELWRSHFGGDPDLVGRTIRLDREDRTVVGVLPPHSLPTNSAAFLVPANLRGHDHKRNRSPWYPVTIYARIRENTTLAQAEQDLLAIRARLASEYPAERATWTMRLEPLQVSITRGVRPMMLSVFAAVGVVLLVACTNVANLLLARSAVREKEIAIRTALGAGRRRIIRQLFAEALLLATAGGLFGVLGAKLAITTMVRLMADAMPRAIPVAVDGRALGVAALLVCGTAVVFGVLPALGSASRQVSMRLAASSRGASTSRRRTQSALIVAQTALTTVLLVGTALFLRSFVNALHVDPGYNPEHTLAFDVVRPGVTVPDADHRIAFAHRAVENLAKLPGVVAAGASTSLPLTQSASHADYVSVDERPETRHDVVASFDGVAGDYFGAMGIQVRRGRVFTAADDRLDAAPAAILDETLARRLFGEADAVGRFVHFQGKAREVIGIVATTHHRRLDGQPSYHVYVPFTAFPWRNSFVIRSPRAVAELQRQAAAAIAEIDPEQPLGNVHPLGTLMNHSLISRRSALVLLVGFSSATLLLALVGIYGLTAYAVAQRRRELGIRVALGALPGRIVQMVVGDALRFAGLGVLLGLAGSIALTRLIEQQLYGVDPHDPSTIAAVAVVLVSATVAAAWHPARLAARTDPIVTLRAE